jgi:hypothetical protein
MYNEESKNNDDVNNEIIEKEFTDKFSFEMPNI